MKNAVKLTLLCVLIMSAVVSAADAPKLVGEKEIMKLDGNIVLGMGMHRGICSMRLSPDGRRVLYLRRKTYKTTGADGETQYSKGSKFVLRDLKTGKDTVVPVPALSGASSAVAWMSMTVFDPTGKTLIVLASQDGNKNDLAERGERGKVGLYDIASGKLKTLDVEGNGILPTFHPNGKTLVMMVCKSADDLKDTKVYVTPTDKIKFRTLSKAGLIRNISPTSDLMAMLLMTEGMPGRCVLYDLKTDTVNAELAGKKQSLWLMEHNPQWTADGRYVYHIIVKSEAFGDRSNDVLTRIWDAKAGKEVSILPGVAPVGPGPGKGTMVLVRLARPRIIPPMTPGAKDAAKPRAIPGVERGIVLHAQDSKTLGRGLHRLGDKSMYPISTQGKWLLFIRKDANGNEKACMAEIALPKK